MSLQKTADVDSPHAVFRSRDGSWEWRVLRTYRRSVLKEAADVNAVWYCAVKSPFTHGSWEYGDVYVRDIAPYALLTAETDAWAEAYRGAAFARA